MTNEQVKLLENKLTEFKQKQDKVRLIDIFIRQMKESEVLDFYTQWGSAPSHANFSSFNDYKVYKSEVYKMFGAEVTEMMLKHKALLESEIAEVTIENILSEVSEGAPK